MLFRMLMLIIVVFSVLLQFPLTKGSSPTTYRVISSVVSVPHASYFSQTVQCSPGDHATGGGPTTNVNFTSTPPSLQVSDSFPTPATGAPTGWQVFAYNPSGGNLNLAATVVCSSAATYKVQAAPVAIPAGGYMSAGAQCNAGDYATGGGATTTTNLDLTPPALVLSDSFPTLTNGKVNGWTVYAYNPTSVPLTIIPIAVCTSAFPVYRSASIVRSIPAGGYSTAWLYCNNGDYATGGGPSTSVTSGAARISLALSDSFADVNVTRPNGWRAYEYNPTSSSLNLVAWVVCIGAGVTLGCGSGQTCTVQSNATVSPVTYSSNSLQFNVTGTKGTNGYVNTTIPKSRAGDISKLKVSLNGTNWPYTYTANSTHYFIYFTFTFHSSYDANITFGVSIVPLYSYDLTVVALTLTIIAAIGRATSRRSRHHRMPLSEGN